MFRRCPISPSLLLHMPNKCLSRRNHKGGNCPSCNCCILCKAPEGCQEKPKHRWRVPKRGGNRGGQQTVGLAKDRPSKRRRNDEDESQVWCQFIKKDRESKNVAKSSIALQAQQGGEDEIATIMPIPEANDQSNIEKKVDLASDYQLQKLVNSKAKELVQSTDYLVDAFTEQTATPFNPKQRISIIMAVIGIEKKEIANLLSGFRNDGEYKNSELIDRADRRIKSIYGEIFSGIDKLVCCDEMFPTSLHHRMLATASEGQETRSISNLERNVLDLSILGHRSTSAVASAILASSFVNEDVVASIRLRVEGIREEDQRKEENERRVIAPSRTTFARKRFKTARSNFDLLKAGKEMERIRLYAYRVEPSKLRSAMEFLTTKLPFRPGLTRTMKIDKYIFKALPVYQRGGKSLEDLFFEYKKCQTNFNENALGQHSFVELVKFISAKGETKTGLSTYYVKLSHALTVFKEMLVRLKCIDELKIMKETWMGVVVDEFLKESDLLQDFLTYGYSKEHLQIDSKFRSLCCRHALNEKNTCGHTHNGTKECKKCSDAVNFFSKFTELIDTIKTKDPALSKE